MPLAGRRGIRFLLSRGRCDPDNQYRRSPAVSQSGRKAGREAVTHFGWAISEFWTSLRRKRPITGQLRGPTLRRFFPALRACPDICEPAAPARRLADWV